MADLARLFAHVTRKSLDQAGYAPRSPTTNFTIELDLPGLVATAIALLDDPADPHFDLLAELAGLDASDKADEWTALEALKKVDPAFFEEREPAPPAWYDFTVEMTRREDGADYVDTGYIKIVDPRADPVEVRVLVTETAVWTTLAIARSALAKDAGTYKFKPPDIDVAMSIARKHLHPPLRDRLAKASAP